MNNHFLATLEKIIDEYGDDVFDNVQRTHAILLDLSQNMVRERLLARHFVESGGYQKLKNAKSEYLLVRGQIIKRLTEQFSVEHSAAIWITNIFAKALGYETISSGEDEKPQKTFTRPRLIPSDDSGSAAYLIGLPQHSQAVAIGKAHTVAVMQDGTVMAKGRNDFLQCDVGGWRQIISVSAGDGHTVGLQADGTVLAVGRNDFDQCDVANFQDISAVYAFGDDTIGIRKNGTALAVGKSKLDVSHFVNIRSIAWHPDGVYGIDYNGAVWIAGSLVNSPNNLPNSLNPSSLASLAEWEEREWALSLTGVVQIISTYVEGSIVLKDDGRVYKMGEPDSYFAHLRDIVSMVDLTDGFAVLREDGAVRIMPYDRKTPRKASNSDLWEEIIAVFGKYKRLIGLTSQGELRAVCTDPDWVRRNGSLDFLADWYPVMVE